MKGYVGKQVLGCLTIGMLVVFGSKLACPGAPVMSFAIPSPFLVVTAARLPAALGLDQIRQEEYAHGLAWVAAKGLPAAIVVSETTEPWDVVDRLSWTLKLAHTSSRKSKSAKEADCLRALVVSITQKGMSDDVMIFKLSGRYQVVRDDVLLAVRDHPDIDMVCRRDALGQIFTFFFGLKWKYFREFYLTADLDLLETRNVEQLLSDYVKVKQLKVWVVPTLWVVANIANGGEYTLY